MEWYTDCTVATTGKFSLTVARYCQNIQNRPVETNSNVVKISLFNPVSCHWTLPLMSSYIWITFKIFSSRYYSIWKYFRILFLNYLWRKVLYFIAMRRIQLVQSLWTESSACTLYWDILYSVLAWLSAHTDWIRCVYCRYIFGAISSSYILCPHLP